MKKRILWAALAFLLLFGGCAAEMKAGSKNEYHDTSPGGAAPSNDSDYSYNDGEKAPDVSGGSSGLSIGPTNPDQKLIYIVTYRMETTEFSAAAERLKTLTAELEGYTEGSTVQSGRQGSFALRTGEYVLRIPTENLNTFFAKVGTIAHIVHEKLESSDVTLEFIDTTARMEALKAQEKRIIELLSQATDLQYVLEIERELTTIRSEVERLTSRLNRLSSQVDYSTVTITLNEVSALSEVLPVPLTFGERLAAAFSASVKRVWNGVQDLGVWLLGNVVEIVLYGGLIALAVLGGAGIYRRSRRRSKEKAAKQYQEIAAQSERAKKDE